MGLRMKKSAKSNIPPLPAGVYMGICVGVVDLGEQRNEKFKKYQDKVLLIWEIVGEFVQVEEEGKTVDKPRWLSKEYAASADPKSNLCRDVMAWRSVSDPSELEDYAIPQLLGTGCQLQVLCKASKDGTRTYNDIGAVIGLPKGVEVGPPISETLIYSLEESDEEVFAKLPGWVQDKIQASTQYVQAHANSQLLDIVVDEEGRAVDASTGVIVDQEAPF